MIIDTFLYNGEEKILELRLRYLASVVDEFIIIESDTTHSGKSKSLYFPEHKQEIPLDILCKVQYYAVSTSTSSEFTSWEREYQQRNYIADFIRNYPPSSYVMMSDVDEIPKRQFVADQYEGVFVMPCFWYFVNWLSEKEWFGTVGMPVSKFLKRMPQEWRDMRRVLAHKEDMGWHFSYTGGAEEVKRKLSSFAHIEYDTPRCHQEFVDRIKSENFDVWELEHLPDELLNNQEQYKRLIWYP